MRKTSEAKEEEEKEGEEKKDEVEEAKEEVEEERGRERLLIIMDAVPECNRLFSLSFSWGKPVAVRLLDTDSVQFRRSALFHFSFIKCSKAKVCLRFF